MFESETISLGTPTIRGSSNVRKVGKVYINSQNYLRRLLKSNMYFRPSPPPNVFIEASLFVADSSSVSTQRPPRNQAKAPSRTNFAARPGSAVNRWILPVSLVPAAVNLRWPFVASITSLPRNCLPWLIGRYL